MVEIEVEGIGTLRNRLATPRSALQPLRFTAPNERAMPEPLSAEELLRVRGHAPLGLGQAEHVARRAPEVAPPH